MSTRSKRNVSFLKVLNENLSQYPVWSTLFKKTSDVLNATVMERITQLYNIRDPYHVHRGDYLGTDYGRGKVTHTDRIPSADGYTSEISVNVDGVGNVVIPFRHLQDRGILIDNARFLGFDYFSDSLSDEDYARVMKYIGDYWDNSSGINFVAFMGFVKNIRFEIEQLWTKDKGDFANSDDSVISKYDILEPNYGQFPPMYGSTNNPTLVDSNLYYPTSHVEINYDLGLLKQAIAHKDFNDVVSLFYYLAPIHLVLERINAFVEITKKTYKGSSVQIHEYDQVRYTWQSKILFTKAPGASPQLHGCEQTSLWLDSSFASSIP